VLNSPGIGFVCSSSARCHVRLFDVKSARKIAAFWLLALLVHRNRSRSRANSCLTWLCVRPSADNLVFRSPTGFERNCDRLEAQGAQVRRPRFSGTVVLARSRRLERIGGKSRHGSVHAAPQASASGARSSPATPSSTMPPSNCRGIGSLLSASKT
jgi:hypothetical protein